MPLKFLENLKNLKLAFFKNINPLSLGNLKIKFHSRNYKSITFFVTFTFSLSDKGICLPLIKENELNEENQQIKNKLKFKKVNLTLNKRKKNEKNHRYLYKSLNYVHRLLKIGISEITADEPTLVAKNCLEF